MCWWRLLQLNLSSTFGIRGIEDLIKIELRFSDFADHSMLRLLDLFTDGPGVLFDLREQEKSFIFVIRMHLLSVSCNEGILSVSCTLLISSKNLVFPF